MPFPFDIPVLPSIAAAKFLINPFLPNIALITVSVSKMVLLALFSMIPLFYLFGNKSHVFRVTLSHWERECTQQGYQRGWVH